MSSFAAGVAFIYEGQTEKAFYSSIIEHYLHKHYGYSIEKQEETDPEDFRYTISNKERSIVLKEHIAGHGVAQASHIPANWFRNNCYRRYGEIAWTVFLCYDTESHTYDITQFYEGDWAELRKSIEENDNTILIDLASSADIEDTMLLDFEGVCRFLGIAHGVLPSGRKGKVKMKRLFRSVSQTYHEGERAKPLIASLDKSVIIGKSAIPFYHIEQVCFK